MGAPTAEQTTSSKTMDHINIDDSLPTDSPIPEEDVDSLVIMSDDAGQVYAPPAHLAARFYRNSASARRKSSAASSRRNSLSSNHSHTSSARQGSTFHSNHVAQHLRRASIIESRKARLADRAAHAEQVRLRAALAKAAPRNSTTSEERALAAQIAREKYLAKVTAQCAEEVQRAKQKAQEMKQRKLEEEQRARSEMEERLAEADKRRAIYRRNLHVKRTRRTSSTEKKLDVLAEDAEVDSAPDADMQSVGSGSESVLDDETAALRIQKYWRVRRRKGVVDAYMDLDLTLNSSRDTTFEDMGGLISSTPVIEATSKVLKLLELQDASAAPTDASTRTFLSAYLVVTHPTAVLSKNGAQEQDLVAKAREFVVLFESVISRLAPWNGYKPAPTRLESLGSAHTTYAAAFDAWRTQDSSALVEAMVAQFVELDAIWQTVKDDTRGEVANDYREGIRDNQVILLSKIRKLAGPDRADFLIKMAIRESRRKRVKRRSPAEVRPRVAENEPTSSTDAAGSLSSVTAQGLSSEISQPQDGNYQSQGLSKLFSPIPSNRIITHELAIDKEYRILPSPGRDLLNRELCDTMRVAVEKGEGTLWTVAMAENIRGKLLRILKPGNSLYETIAEVLDTDHIYRQASQGVFSYGKFFSWIATILPKLCAPFRDEEVKKLADDLEASSGDNAGEMIEKLFRLLHVIDLLSLDYSNFLLMNAAPVLVRESAGYEQRMFASDIASGAITLQKTKRWWRNASVNMLTEADRRDPESIRNLADRPSPQKIYSRGLVDLALAQDWSHSLADLPETLHLDVARLRDISTAALKLTTIAAILLTAKNLLKRDVRSQWKKESQRLVDLLLPLDLSHPNTDLVSVTQEAFRAIESAHNMPEPTKAVLSTAIARFLSQEKARRFSDPVLKVLWQRLRGHVFARVSALTPAERVRGASTAGESLAGAGFPEFVGRVGEMVEVLRRVADVDWAAHASWYDGVAREVMGAGEVE